MKQLFLQRLPTNAQFTLASTKDDLDVESLAKLADKILAQLPLHTVLLRFLGGKTYNELPIDIRKAETLNDFNMRLETFLIT